MCEALRDNLKAAAARKAEPEQAIEVLKQKLADLKVKAAKKGKAIKNMDKMSDQLRSEREQLEHYNQYLANECRRKRFSHWSTKEYSKKPKAKTKVKEKCLSEIRNWNIVNRSATLYEILLVKSSASKNQIRKHYLKKCLLTHPDAGGDKKLFKAVNRHVKFWQMMRNGKRTINLALTRQKKFSWVQDQKKNKGNASSSRPKKSFPEFETKKISWG